MKRTYETGLNGEKIAENWLCREKGMVCLERRYRTKVGEIDLIMLDRDTVVFVEVKTRQSGYAGLGLQSINSAKQKRIIKAATLYLLSHHSLNASVRFDAMEIHQDGHVLYIPNAFVSSGMFFK